MSRIAQTSMHDLNGKYVRLRPLLISDAEITLDWRLSSRARLLNDGAQTVIQQEAWIQSRPENEMNFIIEGQSGESCGMVSLIGIDSKNLIAEPARFLVDQRFSKQPIAVEATSILYKVAFGDLGLRKLYGKMAGSNKRMLAWQQYFGMIIEGRLKEHSWIDGSFEDLILVALFQETYRSVTIPRIQSYLDNYGKLSQNRDETEK